MAVELIAGGIPIQGVLERLKMPRLPDALVNYFFCSPNMDFTFRCLPSSGGLRNQRYRDFIEFNIIENRLRDIQSRKRRG